ncbi:hypothetical protein DFH09DRAFT_1111722 [Mycena vulgaris]|nr:hypothetical protein DFH09DRAFT_1111722 [Mycena vulgaris]
MSISRCGLALPLPVDFDTDAHMARPADTASPSHLDLEDKNIENVRIEKSNKISIAYTRGFATARAAGAIGTSDVGAKLLPYFQYSDEEKALLVGSAQVVAATGPLPIYMTMWVAAEQLKASAAEATEKGKREKEREAREVEKAKAFRPIKGTLLIENPHPISSTISGPAHIPAAYHTSLTNKIYFPLHWWSDKTLRHVTKFPHTLPTEPLTAGHMALLSAPANRIVHVKKALLELGDEDVKLLTPGVWRQSSLNMLDSFRHLCPAIDPTDPDPNRVKNTFASEYELHVKFFGSLDCFEDGDMLPVWYAVERRLRDAVLAGGLHDARLYESRVDNALSNYEQMRDHGLGFALAPLVTSLAAGALKRPASTVPKGGVAKTPRLGRGGERPAPATGAGGGAPSGGSSAPRDSSGTSDRAPSCLICADAHSMSAHPAEKTQFQDRSPLFCSFRNNDLRTVRPFGGFPDRSVCITYNFGKNCTQTHSDRLHICSLCGGNHFALSRDASCKRIRAGAFLL